jgi:hypothetical protein
MSKKVWLPVVAAVVLVLVVAGAALAQGATPPASGQGPAGKAPALAAFGNIRWSVFDAAAQALGLTPTQLFQQLHGGKTLAQVAQDQKVDPQVVRQAVQAATQTARHDAQARAIDAAEKSGKITADQAGWLRQGLKNGWFNRLPLGNILARRPRALKNLNKASPQAPAPVQPAPTPTL